MRVAYRQDFDRFGRTVSPARFRGPRHRRFGYTLLELLLVLSVVVVVAGIAWPSIEGLHERHLLKQAAEQARVHVSAARLRAIETGAIYQFRFETGGRGFTVLPAEPAIDQNEGVPTLEGTLPEDVRFEIPTDQGPAVQTGVLDVPPDAAGLEAGNAAQPILFLPDGSATDAVFHVVDAQDRFIRLTVRGLTGGVQVGDVQRRSGP